MKTKTIDNFNSYELKRVSKLKTQGGATEELFGAYHFLLEVAGTKQP